MILESLEQAARIPIHIVYGDGTAVVDYRYARPDQIEMFRAMEDYTNFSVMHYDIFETE